MKTFWKSRFHPHSFPRAWGSFDYNAPGRLLFVGELTPGGEMFYVVERASHRHGQRYYKKGYNVLFDVKQADSMGHFDTLAEVQSFLIHRFNYLRFQPDDVTSRALMVIFDKPCDILKILKERNFHELTVTQYTVKHAELKFIIQADQIANKLIVFLGGYTEELEKILPTEAWFEQIVHKLEVVYGLRRLSDGRLSMQLTNQKSQAVRAFAREYGELKEEKL